MHWDTYAGDQPSDAIELDAPEYVEDDDLRARQVGMYEAAKAGAAALAAAVAGPGELVSVEVHATIAETGDGEADTLGVRVWAVDDGVEAVEIVDEAPSDEPI